MLSEPLFRHARVLRDWVLFVLGHEGSWQDKLVGAHLNGERFYHLNFYAGSLLWEQVSE